MSNQDSTTSKDWFDRCEATQKRFNKTIAFLKKNNIPYPHTTDINHYDEFILLSWNPNDSNYYVEYRINSSENIRVYFCDRDKIDLEDQDFFVYSFKLE